MTRCRFPRVWMWPIIRDNISLRMNQRLNRSELLPAWWLACFWRWHLPQQTSRKSVPSLWKQTWFSTGPLTPFFHFATLQHGPCNQLSRLESNQCTEATRGEVLHWLSLMTWKFWSHRWNPRQSVTSICILTNQGHVSTMSHWRIMIPQKDPSCWSPNLIFQLQ